MSATAPALLSRRDWIVVSALALIGLALRIALAQGALWLDEAWSAVHADEARTPLGVFLGINHDNNHHLNSLWMQAVGIDAAPMLQRALAIVTGTLSVPVAASLLARNGRVAALVAAALFAVSPFFVTYGSEARGYAPMILASMMVLTHVDRWLAGADRPTLSLAIWAAIGMLAQLMMAITLVAATLWAFAELVRRAGWRAAAVAVARAFAPAAIVAGAILGGIVLVARLGPGEMRFGSYEAFTYFHQLKALSSITGYAVGVPDIAVWPLILALALFGLAVHLRLVRLPFYWLALIGFPAVVAVVEPANPGHARYYTLLAIALLLLIAQLVDRCWAAKGTGRALASIGLSAIVIASLVEDARLIRNQRGDPGRAVAVMASLAPGGASALVERDSAVPVFGTAARTARYPLTITRAPCPAADFLLIDRYNGELLPGPQTRCGSRYQPIATRYARGMTNFHWRLYRRR